MRPSESSVGQAWLTNFHEVDRPAATVLLDSIRFVSFTQLWTGLIAQIRKFDPSTWPFVVFPERALSTVAPSGDPSKFVAWSDFDPGDHLAIPAGSDAFVSMVLKELDASATKGQLPTASTLEELRNARCRSIVILTDNSVTGHQAEAFAQAVARNPTIRSWRSGGFISIRVAAYIASPEAIAFLKRSRHVDSVHRVEVLPTLFTVPLPDVQREAAFDVCRRYGRGAKLGYANSAALFASERRAPDNMPSVFLRDDPGWKPLFPGRSVPVSFVTDVVDHRPAEAYPQVAERLGQLRLGRNERVESAHRTTRDVIHVLTLASRGKLVGATVAASLGVDLDVADAWMTSLRNWRFLDADGALTEAGRRELAEYRRGTRKTTAGLESSDAPYYHEGVR